jgi:predicted Rossmann fold flavoprotein
VALVVKDPWCHALQGQKVRASVTAHIQGKEARKATGELLFTQYGLSGTAILDVSDEISVALNRDRVSDVTVTVDLVPFMAEKDLEVELSGKLTRGIHRENLLEGLLPHKMSGLLRGTLREAGVATIAQLLKHKEFKVIGTRGWNEAEFSAGGVRVEDVDPQTLESRLQKGLYFAGEILDVQGRRGGYNLAWAWASGAVSGVQRGQA